MSSTILIMLAIAAIAIILIGASLRSGPRVTTIETVHEKEEGEDRS